MEIRASYLLVGAVVLVLLAGLAAFSVWLVGADVDRNVAVYEIVFAGSVSGLPEGGQVLYRGIPVGRVADIRIDPDNVEQVLVTVELEKGTPIKEDTVATLEMQGITGIAYVQLRGGTEASAPLVATGDRPARIASRPSALEQVFESTPELLVHAVVVADRLTRLLSDDNIAQISAAIDHVARVTGTLAAHDDDLDAFLAGAGSAGPRIADLTDELVLLTADLRDLTAKLDQRFAGVGDDLVATLTELQGAAGQLDGLVGDLRQPLDDFASTGLYEFTQLVGETRLLVAALTRITKEFERDPAGFLLGRTTRGFEAQ
jgi:phospholipid/cholesterol/gamma-HCH transport system substrate-binding protein